MRVLQPDRTVEIATATIVKIPETLFNGLVLTRRGFLLQTIGAGAVVCSGCTTLVESDQAYFCDGDGAARNMALCRQITIQQSLIVSVSLGVLVGAAIGAVIGQVALRNAGLGAAVGGLAGGSIGAITALYSNHLNGQAGGKRDTAAQYLLEGIRNDTKLVQASIEDISATLRAVSNALPSEKPNEVAKGNITLQVFVPNIKALDSAAKGYQAGSESQLPTTLDSERATEELVDKVEQAHRISPLLEEALRDG